MIIFGAGASHGSDTENVPPLMNSLMDALENFAPDTWGKLSQEYKDECRRNFEQGMQLISLKQKKILTRLQRAMAEYFFLFTPKVTNLYFKLAERIKASDWYLKGNLVSLNYDRLLLESLRANYIQVSIGGKSLTDFKQVEVCLPHGCCNLFPIVNVDGEVMAIDDSAKLYDRIVENGFPPVMSYIEPGKNTFSGKSFIKTQRTRYCKLVLNSSKIVMVGLKVHPEDIHIWSPLAQTNAEVIYCSGIESCKEFIEWSNSARIRKNSTACWKHFKEAFNYICSELEL